MQTVKALKPLPGRQEGSVFSVDEDSAKVLQERGDVEFVDDAAESGGVFVRSTTRRSGAAVTQVAAADYPEQTAPAEDQTAPADESAGDTAEPAAAAVTRASNKADLVAYAVGKLKHDDGIDYTEAEIEGLSKPELVAALKL